MNQFKLPQNKTRFSRILIDGDRVCIYASRGPNYFDPIEVTPTYVKVVQCDKDQQYFDIIPLPYYGDDL